MTPDFSNVKSGSSSTADGIPYRYSYSEAIDFINKYGDTPILGDNGWWFNYKLRDYVSDKGMGWPPHGIIVKPDTDNILVWYDASGRLVVINLSSYEYESELVTSIKNPEYFENPEYLALWNDTIKQVLPNINMMLLLVLGIGAVLVIKRR